MKAKPLNRLLLFTSAFPYGRGEQFLEAELNVLKLYFDEIVIVPTWYGGNKSKRALAGSIRVEEPLIKIGTAEMMIRGFFSLTPIRQYLQCFFEDKCYLKFSSFLKFFHRTLRNRYLLNRPETKALLSEQFTAVYFYWANGAALLLPFIKLSAPAVMRFHGGDLYEERYENKGYIPFRKAMLKKLSYAVFISRDGKNYLEKKYYTIPFRSLVSRLGVKDQGLNPTRSTGGPLTIVTCSTLVPEKRIDIIIRALSMLSFPIKWIHFGTGELETEIKELARRLLPLTIKYDFRGQLSNEEIMNYYRNEHVDLFINSSENEGIPVSIMEALSFGIPVLATDVGGVREIVDDSVGRLLPKELKPDLLAGEIGKILKQDDTVLQVIRSNSRRRWEERVDAEKNYADFSKFLLTLEN